MDPDQALKNARLALEQARGAGSDEFDIVVELHALQDLSDAFEALDGWLAKGGFLPKDWEKAEAADCAQKAVRKPRRKARK